MLYNYSFANRKRDLSDVMATVIKDEPRFISNFRTAPDAASAKHEYLEDLLTGRSVSAGAVSNGLLTLAGADAAKLKVGTLLALKDDPALFRVTQVNADSAAVEIAAINGSEYSTVSALPAEGGKFIIVSTPMSEGTSNGDGEENYRLSEVEWNATQIFRKEIVLSGTSLAVNLYGNADNQLNRQTAFALADLARDLNRVALFGRRVEAAANTRGEAGGLYFFGTRPGVPVIDAAKAKLDSFIINDAAQMVLGEGGDPMQILCSPGQARVISNEYRDRIQILRSDDRRGAYVAVIVNEINGKGMTIMADPDMPDGDAWLLDTNCFALANLSGRAISDMDATPNGFDGIRRVAIGELTFEFKNVKQRCCRIKNLLASSDAIAALRSA
ncbi:MAG: hypothetical protein E7058_04530 [Lentisphaerae bacterium]|nr:hypothetical protein [Lentisphaerota bacterium]